MNVGFCWGCRWWSHNLESTAWIREPNLLWVNSPGCWCDGLGNVSLTLSRPFINNQSWFKWHCVTVVDDHVHSFAATVYHLLKVINTPGQKVKIANWFHQQELHWPSQSPDVNPVEPLWSGRTAAWMCSWLICRSNVMQSRQHGAESQRNAKTSCRIGAKGGAAHYGVSKEELGEGMLKRDKFDMCCRWTVTYTHSRA